MDYRCMTKIKVGVKTTQASDVFHLIMPFISDGEKAETLLVSEYENKKPALFVSASQSCFTLPANVNHQSFRPQYGLLI